MSETDNCWVYRERCPRQESLALPEIGVRVDHSFPEEVGDVELGFEGARGDFKVKRRSTVGQRDSRHENIRAHEM